LTLYSDVSEPVEDLFDRDILLKFQKAFV